MVPYLLFALFAATLFGVARYHHRAVPIALAGLVAIALVQVLGAGLDLPGHLRHEAAGLLNLGGLLLGFALLAEHFQRSRLTERLFKVLPAGRAGAFLLLVLVAVVSTALDNIAAALIGASAATVLFRGRVHTGYLAAIVAASNAGGACSVVGDTTTTMIWLAGVSPLDVLHAGVAAAVAIACFGWFAAGQQRTLQPMVPAAGPPAPIDGARLLIVALILVGAIAANLLVGIPAAGVWAALLLGAPWRPPTWAALPGAARGTAFLLSLVLAASMMPVDRLPAASMSTAFGLGVVSAFFDNIPLTKLAIEQGGYDWGFLAYCVGYGGSMLWFGSSAGVAVATLCPQAKSTAAWVKGSWHVALGYALGFAALALLLGWHPHAARHAIAAPPPVQAPSTQR